mmetsp:Transcript_78952/g.231751  ORF Transcript_78952/g.231751 Transcript_78952/m.231751 type:complete len:989 (-) Transcript_78952:268-3234(-)
MSNSKHCEGTKLQAARSEFGSSGRSVKLRSNHFELHFDGRSAHLQKWLAWQVDLTVAVPAKSKGRGQGGEEVKEPPKKVRVAALQDLLKDLCADVWLYDGSHRLYTNCAQACELPLCGTVRLAEARGPVRVHVKGADDQRGKGQLMIDLGNLVPGARAEAVDEELRFLQVALRQHATGVQGLITRGRKTVCPELQLRLGCQQDQALLRGREVWMGYMALLQLVDGRHGQRFTLNLNLVGSVGLQEMRAIDLLAFFLADLERKARYTQPEWSRYLQGGNGDREVFQHLCVLESATGLRDLKVKYGKSYLKYDKKATVKGLTAKPASHHYFHHEKYGNISVKDYFKDHYNCELACPHLPCLQLQTRSNCVPLELVTVLGGEHNILTGKLKPEYQAAVGKATTMMPQHRQQEILSLMSGSNRDFGPCQALEKMGMSMRPDMLSLTGRVLDRTSLKQSHSKEAAPNGYANYFSSINPPSFEVRWGIWCYAKSGREQDLDSVVAEWVSKGKQHNIRFAAEPWPRKWLNHLESGQELWDQLQEVHRARDRPHLLLVLLPASKEECKTFYSSLKTWTELDLRSFATQCVNCTSKRDQPELEAVKLKFNNLMLKVTAKLPQGADGTGAAHNVELQRPHSILQPAARTMVIGADVTHDCGGVSMAGVVATGDGSLSTYLSNLRAQSPFILGVEKQRRRQSEERIVELSAMVKELLWLWHKAHGYLPENILYYRDGVSYGQFTPVLTYELNELTEAFHSFSDDYSPKLVIIVGQKRHHTRFFLDDVNLGGGITSAGIADKGKGKGKERGKGVSNDLGGKKGGKDVKGKGGGKGCGGGKGPDTGEQPAHLEPGTVAGEGIAVPGHLNFFLVSHRGLKGTSVPCHYHVLHKDVRLTLRVDDVERITYDLCHLYSRADKTVSYASPAYMADHLCERGKLYLETLFPALDDSSWSTVQGSSDDDEAERRFREKVNERCAEFNNQHAWKLTYGETQQGRNFFC